MLVPPSPKFHAEPAVAPNELFVIIGVSGVHPAFNDKLKEAIGLGKTVIFCLAESGQLKLLLATTCAVYVFMIPDVFVYVCTGLVALDVAEPSAKFQL